MPSESRSASVLVIDSDAAIRRLIAAILQQAGFRAYTEEDRGRDYAVIVRDVNLTPGARDGSLQQLEATAPEVLRRTIVLTTAPARASKAIRGVFAILGKPFDLDELVDAVKRCAGTPLKPDSVRRFVSNVPNLKRELSVPVTCEHGAVLRGASIVATRLGAKTRRHDH